EPSRRPAVVKSPPVAVQREMARNGHRWRASARQAGPKPSQFSTSPLKRTRVARQDDIRAKALADLQRYEVLMLNGHFDFGNGYHGTLYLNPHQLFRYPSTIWRFAQDLLDVLPASILDATEVVAGPVTGGA